MTFAQVAGLAIRLFSLWLFLVFLQLLGAAFALHNGIGSLSTAQSLVALLPTGVILIAAILLWCFPLGIARTLIPRGAEQATTVTLREAWRLGCVLLGLFTLASAVPQLVYALVVSLAGVQADLDGLSPTLKAELAFAAVKTALGLFFVFGSDHIHRRFVVVTRRRAGSGADGS